MFDWNQWLHSSPLILPWEGPVSLPSPEESILLVQSSFSWVSEGLFSNLVKFTPDLVEFFIEEQGLPIDEPLLGLIDQGFEYTALFRILWELRFWNREEPGVTPRLALALRGWLRGFPLSRDSQKILQRVKAGRPPEGPFKRLDNLCFLLTLAHQQKTFEYSVFAVIGLNKILEFEPAVQKERLQELYDLYLMVNRWKRFGSNIRLIYEFSRTPEFLRSLHEHCPRLEVPLRCST